MKENEIKIIKENRNHVKDYAFNCLCATFIYWLPVWVLLCALVCFSLSDLGSFLSCSCLSHAMCYRILWLKHVSEPSCLPPSASCCLACVLAQPKCFIPHAHSHPSSSLASLALVPSVSYSLSGWNGPEWVHSGRVGKSEKERWRTAGVREEESCSLMPPFHVFLSVYLPCVSPSTSLAWLILFILRVWMSPSICLECLLLLDVSVSFGLRWVFPFSCS